MNYRTFLNTWRGVQWENRLGRVIILGLVITNLLAWVQSGRQERAVVLVPPGLHETVTVAARQADGPYRVAWGLFLAQTLGNVTPGNADLVLAALDPLLAPELYHALRAAVADELALLKREQITTRFSPRLSEYDAAANRVVISGQLETSGVTSRIQRGERTYEFILTVNQYRPQLQAMSVYSGPPKNAASRSGEELEKR